MADMAKAIFNRKATEKLRSPDDLDKYVQVTNPSVWIVLVACIALLAGLLAWGIFGTVATSVTAAGVSVKGEAMCFLPAETVSKVQVGDVANVGGKLLTVESISDLPSSRDEIDALITSDYLVSTLVMDDWTYIVRFEGDTSGLKDGIPLSVNITTERMAPIELILGGVK